MQKSVLVVDDNAAIRKAVRFSFEQGNGFQIAGEAVDGLDAIEKAKQLKPDLIILDFSMPLMNGIEAACVLSKAMPSAVLILFTMHDGVVVDSDARSAGIRLVVSKAAGPDGLVSQAQTLLGIPLAKRSQAEGI